MGLDKYEKLKELKSLLDKGLLDENEFSKLKNEILFSDDGISKNDSGHNTLSNTESYENEQNNSPKPNVERNIFEEIAFKNNQKINIGSPPKVKTKINNNLVLFVVIVVIVLFFKFYKSSDEREIQEICPDCNEFIDIRKTSWILVKNSENKSNVYDKKSHNFLLKNWYEAKYDEGVVYDDITFQVNGNSKMCSEHEYQYLKEKGDDYLDGTFVTEAQKIKNNENHTNPKDYREWRVCNNCTGSSCTRCFGRGYYWGKEH
jgi:hypothetical protein